MKLRWITASEVDNLGYALLRSQTEHADYQEIANYENTQELEGAGNSPIQNTYSYIDRQDLVNGQTYWYKLVDIDFNGNRTEHGPVVATPHVENMEVVAEILPSDFKLLQNYPNPFNPSTIIEFLIPKVKNEDVMVTLNIYNPLGQRVHTMYNDILAPGSYKMEWSGIDQRGKMLPSGFYLYEIRTAYFTQQKKMLLIR